MSDISTTPSNAYQLALSLRPNLIGLYDQIENQLNENGSTGALRAFSSILNSSAAAINMSVPSLNRFLTSGRWLNIYEAVSEETGMTGIDLQKEVEQRIPRWYPQRRIIEQLFDFNSRTHYAALNLDGAGPERYGVCCVVLDLSYWSPFHTCYGGDSIRACFDARGDKALNDTEILRYFGIGQDTNRVAVIRHHDFLTKEDRPGLDRSEVRHILEASDSLIEVHLHGPVAREHIVKVIMSRAWRNHFWELSMRASAKPRPWPQEYDIAPFFLEMVRLLDQYQIPLVLAEGI